jgi:hypothetical protein
MIAAAIHLENLLFLLFIAVAFFFQLLTKAASKANKSGSGKPKPGPTRTPSSPRPSPSRPSPRVPVESDADRIRKFLEALGQPPTSEPPPPVTQRPTYQKPFVLPHVGPGSPLPPLTTRPPELPPEITLPGQIRPMREAKVFTPKVAEAPRFEVQTGASLPAEAPPVVKTAAEAYAIATQPASTVDQTRTDLVRLLGSASGLREAIILREIFGAPRSLQPLTDPAFAG